MLDSERKCHSRGSLGMCLESCIQGGAGWQGSHKLIVNAAAQQPPTLFTSPPPSSNKCFQPWASHTDWQQCESNSKFVLGQYRF